MRKIDPAVLGQSKGEVIERLKRVVWRVGVCDGLQDRNWRVVEGMGRRGRG